METQFGSVEVFDAHVHFFARTFFEALARQSAALSEAPDPLQAIRDRSGVDVPSDGAESLAHRWVAELDRAHVARALVMASIPGDEDAVGSAIAAFPERLYGSFMLDPTSENAPARARKALDELGLRVVCLFPAMHRYSVAETDAVREIVASVAERPGTAVFVHCGVLSIGIRKKLGLPSRFDMRRSNPLDVHPLALEFPSVPFIVPHFGAGMLREALMLADLCSNVYLDTSSTNGWTRYDVAQPTLAQVFSRALDVLGPTRLLFGSDSSFFPRGWHGKVFEQQVAALAEAGCTLEDARAIFGNNLRGLLKIAE
jgi:uncharacterized protein